MSIQEELLLILWRSLFEPFYQAKTASTQLSRLLEFHPLTDVIDDPWSLNRPLQPTSDV